MPHKDLCKKSETFVRECELHPTARRLHLVAVTNDSSVDKMVMRRIKIAVPVQQTFCQEDVLSGFGDDGN